MRLSAVVAARPVRGAVRPVDEGNTGRTAPGEDDARRRVAMLYREHAPGLKRRLRRRTGSGEEASDLVHEAFARLLGAAALRQLRHPEAFLNRILRNLLIDRARRSAGRAEHVPIAPDCEPVVPPDQASAIELTQMREQYRALVADLPERMREVFVLHRVEELSYREIAARLDISVRTVEWHIGEAIVRISKGLERP
ncbi:MAG: RNA polymerase sigma factor [Allosphingosinicella sp.]|uniref:RNA polymerase sigma factor n=1 Tax=Allosphingosinicella sp. TaxID=2823234 RepID=UPI003959BBAE